MDELLMTNNPVKFSDLGIGTATRDNNRYEKLCSYCDTLSDEWMYFEPANWTVCMKCFMKVFDKILRPVNS